MTSALALDGARGPDLPKSFARRSDEPSKSPLPARWSDATKDLRALAEDLGLIEAE